MADNTHVKHENFMRLALEQAKLAYARQEVPIGAVLVDAATGAVLALGHNMTITHSDPTAHAEILCIRRACADFRKQRIPHADLYVTLEPCPMCSAAISFARIRHIYYGATDPKSGGLISGANLITAPALHHKPNVTGGILADDCAQLLQDFFKERR